MTGRRPIGLSVPYRRVDDDDDIQDYKKPWRGLTDKDFAEACQMAERGNYLVAFKFIQTKLKELNT